MANGRRPAPGSLLLWAVAVAIALSAVTWQWWTGPSRPRQGEAVIAGETVSYRFARNGVVGEPLRGPVSRRTAQA